MKKWITVILLLAVCTGVAAQTRKAVFIIVDGISADVIEALNTPNLRRIAKDGKYLRAYVGGEKGGYSQTPTISAVGYNSVLTGVWVNKHNIWDNDIAKPNYNYQNIFRIFKEKYPQRKTAIFSSWLDNRTKLVAEGMPEAGNITLDYKFDGYELDTVKFPHDKGRDFMEKIDAHVAAEAANCIRKNAPDLSWVYLEYTDDMGHMYGDSPQFTRSVEKMDEKVGKIYDAIQYRQKQFKEEWLIIITTDHGRDEKTGKGHGGQSARQRSSWIVTNQPQLNNYARYYYPGVVDIMPTVARFLQLPLPVAVSRESDGNIKVECVPKMSTTFTVFFPLSDFKRATIISAVQELPPPHFGNKMVLVIEDDMMNQTMLKKYLATIGLQVTTANNGLEGLAAARNCKPDLILLDSHMPKLNGRETLIQLKEDITLRDIPVVIASGDAFTEVTNVFMKAGANDYLIKPIVLANLRLILERHLNKPETENE